MKAVWLVSWYPNLNDAYDGDFIQRHARAAAIFHDIHVVFVTDREQAEAMKEEKRQATGLTEQVIYFRKPAGLLSALRKQWLWRRQHINQLTGIVVKGTQAQA